MPWWHWSCNICRLGSYPNLGPGYQWTAQCRALYPVGDAYRVSGVTDLSTLSSPFDRIAHFPTHEEQDEKDYNSAETMSLDPQAIPRGTYLVHDDCWKCLRRFFDDEPIPLRRLVETIDLTLSSGQNRPIDVYASRPAHYRPMDYIHHQRRKRFDRNNYLTKARKAMVLTTSDVFTIFPPEICHEIAKHISMPDFYNLRLVSRYMGNLFFSANFWASQFDVDGSRGWLCELKERPIEERPQGTDWHRLYWCNIKNTSTHRKIWHRCRGIKDMVLMALPPRMPDHLRPKPLRNDCTWKTFRVEWSTAPLSLHPINIPRDLTTIVISVITVEKLTFVMGLRLVSKQDVTSLGHILPDSPTIPVRGVFQGFEVASSYDGIQAIRVVVDNASSSWFGNVSKECTTSVLKMPGQLDMLSASFSVKKMVGFDHRPRQPFAMSALYLGCNTSQWTRTAPQDYNAWIPQISPEVKHLNFNLDVFYQDEKIIESDQSIPWMLLGDQDGKQLGYLTQIEVWVHMNLLVEICFAYKEGCETKSRSLKLLWDKDPCQEQKEIPKRLQNTFKIDGPGGERVSKVKAVFYGNAVSPRCYRISTNWNRSFTILSHCRKVKKSFKSRREQDMHAPETLPIGFYGVKRGKSGIVNLGVISTKIV